ncbi:MAG: hypothetical protein GY776_12310 [Alteromonas sp.]|nr:hypothetical protein [Alteromonas sp.]
MTTITVVLDSGVLSASLSAVAAGIVSGTNKSTSDTTTNLTVTGDLTYQGTVIGTQAVKLNSTVLDIGDWDMSLTGDQIVTVAHGLTGSKIRSVDVMIRVDSDETYSLHTLLTNDSATSGGDYNVSATLVTLQRWPGGLFGVYGTVFNETSYNRGWITIWYVD